MEDQLSMLQQDMLRMQGDTRRVKSWMQLNRDWRHSHRHRRSVRLLSLMSPFQTVPCRPRVVCAPFSSLRYVSTSSPSTHACIRGQVEIRKHHFTSHFAASVTLLLRPSSEQFTTLPNLLLLIKCVVDFSPLALFVWRRVRREDNLVVHRVSNLQSEKLVRLLPFTWHCTSSNHSHCYFLRLSMIRSDPPKEVIHSEHFLAVAHIRERERVLLFYFSNDVPQEICALPHDVCREVIPSFMIFRHPSPFSWSRSSSSRSANPLRQLFLLREPWPVL